MYKLRNVQTEICEIVRTEKYKLRKLPKMSERKQVYDILQKVREVKSLTEEEITIVTRHVGGVTRNALSRGALSRVVEYMKSLEDDIVYCVQDGIMSDARSLADAGRHHEQGEKMMRETADDLGVGQPLPKRTRRSRREN